MLSAVQFYDVILFFHILAVVLSFGPTYAYPVFLAVTEKTEPRAVPAIGRAIGAWERIGTPLLVVILAAGIYLVADSPAWSFSDFYVSWGFVAIVIIGGLSGAYFAPKTTQLIEIAERDIEASGDGAVKFSAEFQALNAQIGRVGMFAGILGILTIYVMTAKPFL